MQHQHSGHWQATPRPREAPATLRPPKRHGEDEATRGASPKRYCPSPSPSPDPSWLHPGPRSASESEACTDTASPLPPSFKPAFHIEYLGENAEARSDVVSPHSAQYDLGSMDWVPTHAAPVHEVITDSDPTICYGALCNAKARFSPPGEAKRLLSGNRRFCLLSVARSGLYYVLSTRSSKVVARVDLTTCRALRNLDGLVAVKAAGVIESAAVSRNQEKGGIMPLSINVYGPMSSADQVGRVLSKASAFLQHPFFLEPSCKGYFNPQLFRTGDELEDLTHLVGLTEKDIRAKAISDEVQHILESLDDIAASGHLDSEASWQPQDLLLTCLTDHQATALNFIQRRETHHHCQAMHQRLRGLTDIPSHSNIPSYSTGGILADVMGLGKTLTMIATIVSTLGVSRQYSIDPDADKSGRRIGATLVIVTSMQVLHVWETEIKKHVKPNTLRTCMFHGKTRPTSVSDLKDFDIVLTTYATLSAEHKKQGILHQIDWYRVVLDEGKVESHVQDNAHWIRNQRSKQFKAAMNLASVRRWCLSGTPIQNSLNDLVALLSFLQFEPFSSHAIFHRHVLDPMTNETTNGGSRLKELLRTICLRRDERLLNLPEPRFEQVDVVLQEEERALYDGVTAQCGRDIDNTVSSRTQIKKYAILFTATMKLRRLCNLGTFARSLTTNSTAMTGSGVEDEQEGCEFCSGADEDRLDLINQESCCPECRRQLSLATDSGAPPPEIITGPGDASSRHPVPSPSRASDRRNRTLGDGVSTKLQAVINRLDQTEFGSKSLVFSYWTATLDLLEEYLAARHIRWLRIDGGVPYASRLRILEDFKATDVPVLLMTVETGAVGLNLTAANYVHLVEPQWNPSVEEQAIARAVRMGQTRTVTVIRYVVENSVEQNIARLQRRKRNLAKFTLDGVSQDEASGGTLDDLRFVLDLDFAG